MSTIPEPARQGGPAAAELVLAALVLGLAVAAQLILLDSLYLLRRNFWVDEIYTHTLVSDPDVAHSLGAIAAGFDSNPPGLQVLLRAFTSLTGDTSEVSLRGFALLSVLVGLLGVYAVIRRAYPPLTAFTATLAVWAHPLVLMHAFEARYYGPWLAATVWFCYFLGRSREPSAGWLSSAALAGCAILVCTVHYFGIIALGLAVGAELLARRFLGTFSWSGLLPAILGPTALLACVPLLQSQRSAYTVPTWVSDSTLVDSAQFCSKVLLPMHLAALPLAAWVARLFPGRRGPAAAPAESTQGLVPLVGLTGIALMPPVLVVFSYTVQSALVDRYALPAVASLAPATAFLVYRMSRFWSVTFGVFLILAGAVTLSACCHWHRQRDRQTAELIAAVRRHTNEAPVLFESPHELYVMCRYAPDLAERCFALDWEEGQVGGVDAYRTFLRDSVRSYAKFYPRPALVTWSAASRWERIHLVPRRNIPPREGVSDPQGHYPGFTAQPVEGGLYRLTAVPNQPSGRGG